MKRDSISSLVHNNLFHLFVTTMGCVINGLMIQYITDDGGSYPRGKVSFTVRNLDYFRVSIRFGIWVILGLALG